MEQGWSSREPGGERQLVLRVKGHGGNMRRDGVIMMSGRLGDSFFASPMPTPPKIVPTRLPRGPFLDPQLK